MLGPEVALELARDVEDMESGVVRAEVQGVCYLPDVVDPAHLRRVPGDGPWVLDVAHVHDLEGSEHPARRRVLGTLNIAVEVDLIGDEDIVAAALAPSGVGATREARTADVFHVLVK